MGPKIKKNMTTKLSQAESKDDLENANILRDKIKIVRKKFYLKNGKNRKHSPFLRMNDFPKIF